jgi:hypothetical protein
MKFIVEGCSIADDPRLLEVAKRVINLLDKGLVGDEPPYTRPEIKRITEIAAYLATQE